MRFLQEIIAAFEFLTIVPLSKRISNYEKLHWDVAVSFFPLVGAFIGLIFYFIYLILPKIAFPYICLFAWVFITGGFHLDGLADSFDALALGRTKEERLSIMKDSRVGTFGTIALILVLVFKFFLLRDCSIKYVNVAPIWGRFLLVFIPYRFPSAKSEGLGYFIKQNITLRGFLMAFLLSFMFGLLFSGDFWFTLFSLFIVLSLGLFYGELWYKRVGGFTGDILGSSCEIGETLVLAFSLIWTSL